MTIASSSFAVGVTQVDGRVWITETHVDSVQGPLTFEYLAVNSTNATAVMNARVAQINTGLADAEFEALLAT